MFNLFSIVIVGRFNPSIFHPTWFERFKILPIQETQWALGENAVKREVDIGGSKITLSERPPLVMNPGNTEIHFKSIKILVKPDRFECQTVNKENFSNVHEVTTKVFTLLEHSPTKIVGMNFMGHSKFNEKARDLLKRNFCKDEDKIKSLFSEDWVIGTELIAKEKGLQFRLKLSESPQLENGIFYDANFQREIASENSEEAISIIQSNYDKDLARISATIIKFFGNPEETWSPQEI